MTDPTMPPQDQILAIARDDALLDALGRGEPIAGHDTVADLLALWRADLADESPRSDLSPLANLAADVHPLAGLAADVHPLSGLDGAAGATDPVDGRAATGPVDGHPLVGLNGARPAADRGGDGSRGSTLRVAYPAGAEPAADRVRARRRSGRRMAPASRRARLAVVAAAIAAAFVGGVVVASGGATPGSPLWPISKVVNPERADRIAAENALARARRAIDQRRLTQAQADLNQAADLISRVRDPQDAARLRTELDQLRQLLAAITAGLPLPPAAGPTPTPSSAPGQAGQPTGGGTGGGGAGGGGGGGGGSTGGGGILPPLLPPPGTQTTTGPGGGGGGGGGGLLPTTLPPLPSLIPSILPSLPLPHIGG